MNNMFSGQTIMIRGIVECRIDENKQATLKNLLTNQEIHTKILAFEHPLGFVGACYDPAKGCKIQFADDVSSVFS